MKKNTLHGLKTGLSYLNNKSELFTGWSPVLSLPITVLALEVQHEESEHVEVLPCRQSSWTEGSRALSCSHQEGRSSFPPALVAVPVGSQCTGWRCAGSPPWADVGWGWPRCSAWAPRKRGWLSSAAGARAWWQPACGPQSWTCACRPCRPTGDNVLAGEGLRGPWHAHPPLSQRAPRRGQTPGCLEMRRTLCRSRPGMVRRRPWLVEIRRLNGRRNGCDGRMAGSGVGEREETSEWYEGSVALSPPYMPPGQSLGPTLVRSNYHGPLAQAEGRLGLTQLPPCPIPTRCLSPPNTLQSFPHLHLVVLFYSSPLFPSKGLSPARPWWVQCLGMFQERGWTFATLPTTWPLFTLNQSCSFFWFNLSIT